MKHLKQPPADVGFQLGAISSNLDLSVRVPGISQPPGAIERETGGRDPLDPERLPKRLTHGCDNLFTFVLTLASLGFIRFLGRRFGTFVVLFLLICLPEYRPSCRVVNDTPFRRELGRTRGNRSGEVWVIGRCFGPWSPLDGSRRLFVDGRGHSSVAKVFA